MKTYRVKCLHKWVALMCQTSQVSIPSYFPLGGHLIRVIPTKVFRIARAHNDAFLWNELLIGNLVLPHMIAIVEVEKACMIAGSNVLKFHTSIWIYEYVAN